VAVASAEPRANLHLAVDR